MLGCDIPAALDHGFKLRENVRDVPVFVFEAVSKGQDFHEVRLGGVEVGHGDLRRGKA